MPTCCSFSAPVSDCYTVGPFRRKSARISKQQCCQVCCDGTSAAVEAQLDRRTPRQFRLFRIKPASYRSHSVVSPTGGESRQSGQERRVPYNLPQSLVWSAVTTDSLSKPCRLGPLNLLCGRVQLTACRGVRDDVWQHQTGPYTSLSQGSVSL